MQLKPTDASLYFLLCAYLASTPASAGNPSGFYLGVGGGESDVRADKAILGDSNYVSTLDEQHSAWKAIAGFRPLPPLGVELQYIDFGNPSTELGFAGPGGLTKVGEKAVTLFGVSYLPLPVSFLDVYGKLGIARLRTTLTGLGPLPFCPAGLFPCVQSTFKQTDWSTDLAYGAGVQGKIGRLAIRAEYERISASGGDPDMFSLGVTWTL
jgi:hypothetical protein